uniref:Uncharacterized protein n=1 Tax=Caenorhabditis japonica TaxID=281687 RepID=A0A8R1EE71_CAEJA
MGKGKHQRTSGNSSSPEMKKSKKDEQLAGLIFELLESERFQELFIGIIERSRSNEYKKLKEELEQQKAKTAELESELVAIKKLVTTQGGRNPSPTPLLESASELERKRSVVISGIPEGRHGSEIENWKWDYICYNKITPNNNSDIPPLKNQSCPFLDRSMLLSNSLLGHISVRYR